MSGSAVRQPAVAGSFYPGLPEELENSVRVLLERARTAGTPPKAMILPHAGHVYSGPVAASGYRLLDPVRKTIRRVVLLGPAHRHHFVGLAVPTVGVFETPLGSVEVDTEALRGIQDLPQVKRLDAAHAGEHSLEVHLPFLQVQLERFKLVPIVVGDARPDEVAEVIERLWGGAETLIVISSDLSHFESYDEAREHDRRTAAAIEELRGGDIGPRDACGCVPVSGLLALMGRDGLRLRTLDLRNSGDTAGPRDEVVGYGAFVSR